MTSGTAIAADFGAMAAYTGDGFTIDVSSEAGTSFDQNITGFRAEEEFGFNAEPYVRTGMVQKIPGLVVPGPGLTSHGPPRPTPSSRASRPAG
jgi:hypothetical protein